MRNGKATMVTVADLRQNLSEYLDHVKYNGERILITKRGRDVAVIVPVQDLQVLQFIEDLDIETEVHRAQHSLKGRPAVRVADRMQRAHDLLVNAFRSVEDDGT
jgi:prevent-host-death family protein